MIGTQLQEFLSELQAGLPMEQPDGSFDLFYFDAYGTGTGMTLTREQLTEIGHGFLQIAHITKERLDD